MARRLIPGSAAALMIAVMLAMAAMPVCVAQRHGGFGGSHGFSGAGRGGFLGRERNEFARGYFLGDYPLFYDDYPFAPAVADVGPQMIVLQQPAAETPSRPRPAPLLIELPGDRYVRYGGAGRSSEESQSSERNAGQRESSPDPPQLAATVLIYRDGHREQIPDYAIVGGVLYAHNAGVAEPGYGLRNIQLSALDIAATMRANQENGINFVLPAGPNEVVTRP